MTEKLNGAAKWVGMILVLILAALGSAYGYGQLAHRVKTNEDEIRALKPLVSEIHATVIRIEERMKKGP